VSEGRGEIINRKVKINTKGKVSERSGKVVYWRIEKLS
jgi:hypothetical protein